MRADDPKLKRIDPPRLTLAERLFLPTIAAGLGLTARHMAGVAFQKKAITVQYPEEQHVPSPNYRGVHRLNKDEQGRVKCVACMLCATACPAHCIDIVGATAPETWPDREEGDDARLNLGQICLGRGQYDQAIAALESVRRRSSKWLDAQTRLGGAHWAKSRVLDRKGDAKAAAAEGQKAIDVLQGALKARRDSTPRRRIPAWSVMSATSPSCSPSRERPPRPCNSSTRS